MQKSLLDLTLGLHRKRITKFIWLALLLITIYLAVKLSVDFYLADFVKSKKSIFQNLKELAALDFFRCIYFVALASLYWTALNISRLQQEAAEDKIKQLVISRDHATVETKLAKIQNAYLQQQINPHLLFNSLNFIHSTVHKVSEEAAEHVVLLADIMRFGIKEPGSDGKILLEDELEQLHNLILINQVRFEQLTAVDFRVTGETAGYRIIPLVLMTLAENVFKHGDLTTYPAVITLLVDDTERLRFHTRNRVKAEIPFPRLKSTGLENIRIRLDFAYGDAYNLNLTENDHFFEAELLISRL